MYGIGDQLYREDIEGTARGRLTIGMFGMSWLMVFAPVKDAEEETEKRVELVIIIIN